MKARNLEKLGIPSRLAKSVKWLLPAARARGMETKQIMEMLKRLVAEPELFRADPVFGDLATAMALDRQAAARDAEGFKPTPSAPWKQWGTDIEEESIKQMRSACRLPVAVAGALMPDAHVGYGLPIGGVLATNNAVIPYAVGVDIACRMKLTVLDLPTTFLEKQRDRLKRAIETETRFGVGAEFGKRGETPCRRHDVLDEDWGITKLTGHLKEKAVRQLGTSGSGNHFVEFGLLEAMGEHAPSLGLENRPYLAVLSHSGSRGPGAEIANHYSRLAMKIHPELPKELQHLAWLDLETQEGREYWAAMELMGRFAHANHEVIHRHIAEHLGAEVVLSVENHHNFAWKETHAHLNDGKPVIVHRKGATPAGIGTLGVIPGSMASPCFVVRGRGSAESMNSASHGAGRVMSRRQAKMTYRWAHLKDHLKQRGVEVISAGIDEAPMVYKDIHQVMSQQQDLVEPIARFDPRLVKMAPEGEKAED